MRACRARVAGSLGWDEPREGDLAPDSMPSLSAHLIGKLRNKVWPVPPRSSICLARAATSDQWVRVAIWVPGRQLPPEEVTTWVDRELGNHPQRMELVVHTLLHAGAKSVSHLEKVRRRRS
jgi:hypothetical protein